MFSSKHPWSIFIQNDDDWKGNEICAKSMIKNIFEENQVLNRKILDLSLYQNKICFKTKNFVKEIHQL